MKFDQTQDDDLKAYLLLIAARINELIMKNNINIKHFLESTGMPHSSFLSYRKGEGNITISNLLKISRYFGKPLTYFLDPTATDSVYENVNYLKVYSSLTKDLTKDKHDALAPIKNDFDIKKCFGWRIDTNDIAPLLQKGTILIVEKTTDFKDRDIVLVKDGTNYILRHIHITNKQTLLSSLINFQAEHEVLNKQKIIGNVIKKLN